MYRERAADSSLRVLARQQEILQSPLAPSTASTRPCQRKLPQPALRAAASVHYERKLMWCLCVVENSNWSPPRYLRNPFVHATVASTVAAVDIALRKTNLKQMPPTA